MNQTLDRIKQYLDYKGVNNSTFERTVGLSNGAFGGQLKAKRAIGSDKLENIFTIYTDLSPYWVLTGQGPMIKGTGTPPILSDDSPKSHAVRAKTGIPLIPASAVAGTGEGEVSISEHDILERYQVPDFSGADFMIHVSGNSMQPKYNSGDVIACKIIKERSFFQWGRVFVLHHKDQGIMVKRLFPSDQAKVICRSDNRDYPDFSLDLEDITDIALVMGAIVVD